MSAILNFETHLFISYARIDNESLSGTTQGWIDLLHERLEIRLAQLLGTKPKIWRDSKTSGDSLSSDTALNELPRTALLLSVISPSYIESQACLREVEKFFPLAGQKDDTNSVDGRRIFRIVKTPVPRESLPAKLQGTQEYDFYEEDVLSSQILSFNPLITPSGENDKRYWEKFEDLAIAIRDALISFQKPSERTVQASTASLAKAIYLAETTSDRNADRDNVRRNLEQHGYLVFPDAELPRTDAPELENRVRDYLKRSCMSVHLMGAVYGIILEQADDRSMARIQQEVALKNDSRLEFKRVIWIPDGLEVRESRQEAYINHLQNDPDTLRRSELVQGNIEALKTTIHDLLKPKPKPKVPDVTSSNGQNPARVYLVYDEQDFNNAQLIREYLLAERLEVLRPVNKRKPEDFQEHKELLLLADAVMVYYGQVSDTWSWQKLRELQKLPGYGREKPLLAKAFYLSAPPTEDKEDFITYEADIIKGYEGFQPELLVPFVSKIRDHRTSAETNGGKEKTVDAKEKKVKLFYSYSHKDETFRDELETHLKLLQHAGLIEAWHDRQIGAGDEWATEIDENLESADIILLLISADFIASDYCYKKEMTRALERYRSGEARVIPVILRDVDWRSLAPFSTLQALPKDGKPVKRWSDRDEAWLNVSEGIKKVVEQMRGK